MGIVYLLLGIYLGIGLVYSIYLIFVGTSGWSEIIVNTLFGVPAIIYAVYTAVTKKKIRISLD